MLMLCVVAGRLLAAASVQPVSQRRAQLATTHQQCCTACSHPSSAARHLLAEVTPPLFRWQRCKGFWPCNPIPQGKNRLGHERDALRASALKAAYCKVGMQKRACPCVGMQNAQQRSSVLCHTSSWLQPLKQLPLPRSFAHLDVLRTLSLLHMVLVSPVVVQASYACCGGKGCSGPLIYHSKYLYGTPCLSAAQRDTNHLSSAEFHSSSALHPAVYMRCHACGPLKA